MPYVEDKVKIVPKVWGKEYWLVNEPGYCGKILELYQGHYCSYHMHKIKDETFYIQSGLVLFTLAGQTKVLEPGSRVHITPQTYHRFEGLENSVIIEFSTHHEDEDTYRLEDSGKRV